MRIEWAINVIFGLINVLNGAIISYFWANIFVD